MKHTDIVLGLAASPFIYVLSHFNEIVAGGVGIASLVLLGFRIRREWRWRNIKPDDKD